MTRAALSGRVSEAMCGVTVTRGCAQNGCCGGSGSVRNTSSVAWPQLAVVQCRQQRVVVDQRAPSGIEQHRAARQPRQRGGIDQALGIRASAAAAAPGSRPRPAWPPDPQPLPADDPRRSVSAVRLQPDTWKFSAASVCAQARSERAEPQNRRRGGRRASGGATGRQHPVLPQDLVDPCPDGGAAHGR